MATSQWSVNHPMAQQHWSKDLMKEALKRTQMVANMSKKKDSIIYIKNETKEAGYKVTYGLKMQLQGRGRTGDSTLEGYEEALDVYTDSLMIDQLRHAVRTHGRASEQRVPFDTREEARDSLADWWAGRIDTALFNHLAGINTQTDEAYNANNTIIAPDSDHIIYAGGAGSEASLSDSSTFQFHIGLLDDAVEKAETLSPIINPIMYRGQKFYKVYLHPYQTKDMRVHRSTTEPTWFEAQIARVQGGMVGERPNHPIFSDALGVYNGVIIAKSNYVPASPTKSTVRRAVFLGAMAGCVAFGKANGPGKYTWVEELFDYNNQLGVAVGAVWGAKKNTFNSQDYATIVIATGAN